MADCPQVTDGGVPDEALCRRIAQNVGGIRERILQACLRSGRTVDEVALVGVTKTVGVVEVRALYAAGVRDFGENRVDVGLQKVGTLTDLPDARWHLIGHLQRNKAALAVQGFQIFHGVESPKLVQKLRELVPQAETGFDVFLEVNVAGEESKYGIRPDDALALARQILDVDGLHLRGLMTMAPFTDDSTLVRSVFRGLRQLRDRLQDETGQPLPDLSMGMSGDFEIAVEEGATLVRVGTALFV